MGRFQRVLRRRERRRESGVDLVDGAVSSHDAQQVAPAIVLNQRLCLAPVDFQAIVDGLLAVIVPLQEFSTRVNACLEFFGGRKVDVQQFSRLRTGATAREPLHQRFVGHIHEHGRIQRLAEFRQNGVQGLGLSQISGKAVEYVGTAGVVGAEPVLDDAKHHLVDHQLTSVHG